MVIVFCKKNALVSSPMFIFIILFFYHKLNYLALITSCRPKLNL